MSEFAAPTAPPDHSTHSMHCYTPHPYRDPYRGVVVQKHCNTLQHQCTTWGVAGVAGVADGASPRWNAGQAGQTGHLSRLSRDSRESQREKFPAGSANGLQWNYARNVMSELGYRNCKKLAPH